MRLLSWLFLVTMFIPNKGQTQEVDTSIVHNRVSYEPLPALAFQSTFVPNVELAKDGDTVVIHRRTHFEVLPALAFQPETGFRYGMNSIFYRKLSFPNDSGTRISKLAISAFGTTKQQYYGFMNWLIYTKDNKFSVSGFLQIGKWIDRYYPIGNSVNYPVTEYYGDISTTHNYANFQYNYLDLYVVVNRSIAPHLFMGLTFERDKSDDNIFLADNIRTSQVLNLARNEATRVGIGGDLLYDSRDNTDNPSRGYNVQLITAAYRKELGSTQNYHILTLEADHYIPIIRDHTLALRFVTEYRQAKKGSVIPFRGLSYSGGITTSLRGYFQGTYRDNNMLAFESEYRMPIIIDPDAPLWKVWRRFGLVGFFSGVKVSSTYSALWNFNNIHLAAGLGVRYMVDTKQRINLTVDYAIGLDKDSGLGQRQTGMYFSLGEAF